MATMGDLAIHIRQVLRLPLVMDAPTPGRGNCFFAAVCQQLNNRPELGQQNVYTAAQLRKQSCEFALAKEDEIVKNLAAQHNANAAMSLRTPWDVYFANMKKNGVFAEGPVLYIVALLLRLDIAVMSFGNTISNPYMLVPGHCTDTPMPPPIFVGNQIDLHFQSFLPDSTASQEDLMMLVSEAGDGASKNLSTPTTSKSRMVKSPLRRTLFQSSMKTKKKNLRGVREIGRVGDAVIQNVTSLVRENRRLHALVQTLEYQLSLGCECEREEEKVEDEKDFDSFCVMDGASDDALACTPL